MNLYFNEVLKKWRELFLLKVLNKRVKRWHGRKRLTKIKIKTQISYYRLLWSSVYVLTMILYVGVCCLLNAKYTIQLYANVM